MFSCRALDADQSGSCLRVSMFSIPRTGHRTEIAKVMPSNHFDLVIGKPIKADNCDSFVNSLNESLDYLKKAFGIIITVARFNCNTFFFHLGAARILEFQWDGSEVVFAIARDEKDTQKYKLPTNWEGFEFRTAQEGFQCHGILFGKRRVMTDKYNGFTLRTQH